MAYGSVAITIGAGTTLETILKGADHIFVKAVGWDDGSGDMQTVLLGAGVNAGSLRVVLANDSDVLGVSEHTRNEIFKEATAIGGEVDDTATIAATEGNVSPARITPQRALHTNLRNNAGTEIGTSGVPIRTDPTGTTTQPVSGTVTANIGTSGALALAANQLADGHNVTVDNASGAAAVNIQDGGNVISIDAASLPLPTGAATAALQLAAGHTVTANAGTDLNTSALALEATLGNVQTAVEKSDNIAHIRNAAFVEAAAIGGELDDTATTAATEGNVSPARITAQRALHSNLRNNAGTEVGTSGAPLRTDPTGTTTQPVSGTVTANIGTTGGLTLDATLTSMRGTDGAAGPANAISMGGTETGGNFQELRVDTDGHLQVDVLTGGGSGTEFAEDSVHSTGALGTLGLGVRRDADTSPVDATGDYHALIFDALGNLKVNIKAGGGSGGTSQTDNTAITSITGIGFLFDTTPPTITDGFVGLPRMNGNRDAHSLMVTDDGGSAMDDTNSALRVNIVAGGGAGGTSQADRSAFTDGSGSLTPMGGVFNETPTNPTEDQIAAPRITALRALHTNLRDNAGTEVGTSGAPLRTDPTGTTTQPVSGTVTANIGTAGTLALEATLADVRTAVQLIDDSSKLLGSDLYIEATDRGTAIAVLRSDTLATKVNTDGEWGPLQMNSDGALYVDEPNLISTNNSTTATLGVGATFTGTGDDVSDFSAVTIHIDSSHDSAVDGMTFQFSTDNSDWDDINIFTYVAVDGARKFQFPVTAQFFRAFYTNGGTAQTTFHLQVILQRHAVTPTVHRLADNVNPDRSSTLSKSIILAQAAGSGDFIPVQASAGGNFKIDVEETAGAAITTGSGALTGNEQRVVLATDQPSLTVDAPNDGSHVVQLGDGTSLATVRNLAANDSLNVAIVDGAGGQIGTSGAPVRTDPTGTTTQPVSGTVTANAGTNLNTSALALDATFTAIIGTDGVAGPANAMSMGGTEAGGTFQDVLVDSSGKLIVNIGTAGTLALETTQLSIQTAVEKSDNIAHVANAVLVEAAAIGGVMDDTATVAATEGNVSSVRINAQRGLHVNLRQADGVDFGTAGAPIRTDPTGTTTQPISGTITANAGTNLNTSALNLQTTQVSMLTALQIIDNPVIVFGTDVYSEGADSGMGIAAVRNDDVATLASVDNEFAPLQVNQKGALYVESIPSFGQACWKGDVYNVQYAFLNATASGNTSLVATPGASRHLVVLATQLNNQGATSLNVKFQGATTDVTCLFELAADGGGGPIIPQFETADNVALNFNLAATGTVGVQIAYLDVLT